MSSADEFERPLPDDVVRERLEAHRSTLETLARTDNDLAEDARRALELLDEGDQS